jgi:putative ABC transport system permease protein
MVFRDLLLDTLRTLWSHKLRTFLSMFGIAWGIISITLMVAAGEGFRLGWIKQQETFAKDLMIVFSGRTSMQAGGLRAGRDTPITSTWGGTRPPASTCCQNWGVRVCQ